MTKGLHPKPGACTTPLLSTNYLLAFRVQVILHVDLQKKIVAYYTLLPSLFRCLQQLRRRICPLCQGVSPTSHVLFTGHMYVIGKYTFSRFYRRLPSHTGLDVAN